MVLTDLLDGVRRLARPLALGLAVYGCGGADKPKVPYYEGMCDDLADICLEVYGEEAAVYHKDVCEIKCLQMKNYERCAELYCVIQVGECQPHTEHVCEVNPSLEEEECRDNVRACMHSFGYIPVFDEVEE